MFKVIDNYETLYIPRKFMDAGFKYESILNTIPLDDKFSIVILQFIILFVLLDAGFHLLRLRHLI